MRIIGDVHQKISEYKMLTEQCDESVQLGDMGFDYSELSDLSMKHRFFKGNHDGYNITDNHELGDFGIYDDMFFVRGAYSIDRMYRTPGFDWFPNEQLSFGEMHHAFEMYKLCKPKIMLSHDCPKSVCESLFGYNDNPITRQGLQAMFEYHKPDLWIFGHHHQSKNVVINGTNFICLKELEYIDL